MTDPNPFGIRQSPASIKLAKEIVRIASNAEFEDLRTEMIESLIMREVHGHPDRDGREVAIGALAMVALTVEVLADNIAESAARNAAAQAVADDPRFKERLEAMAREMKEPATGAKPLRRLAIVDDHLRSLDD
ncbi:hypothetical protein J7E45_16105 [Microbacterium sp. ISL-59]|uniref:hypothetical protein n=1 Tax=Microbacterium sp. ISL-59 TaxID=2819159 RepID=UPI001BE7F064|nr:hypothetical protein [Microbacterium sp. ISL-59]MBT2497136.1 hypothetical protein [Microbacterium sp. ISL-59]